MPQDKPPKPQEPPTALVRLVDQPPVELPTVVLEDLVPFPGPVVPVALESSERREAVLHAKNNNGFFLLINRRGMRQDSDLPKAVQAVEQSLRQHDGQLHSGREADAPSSGPVLRPDNEAEAPEINGPLSLSVLSPIGIVARLMKVVRLGEDRLTALVHLMRRAQPVEIVSLEPFPTLRVMYPTEFISNEEAFQSIFRQVRLNLQAFFEAHPTVTEELKGAAMAIDVPATVADFVAQHLSRDFKERLDFLAELDLAERMRHALEVTLRELDLLTVGNRISQEIREKVEKHQRDFLLREQLKAIRAELGEEKDPAALAIAELKIKLDKAGLSKVARSRADEELARLQLLPTESPEHNVVRSYIEWIASLPWTKLSEDNADVRQARIILDEDHFGLEEVKERIVEFLAVHQLNPNKPGSLLCFAGPPGVGKTSLGQSIARALGREFYRFSVGGMRDEAEIKGHRRTYIGSLPGRILQGLRQVQTANPVFMIDELDKMGNDWRGDPSSALLEVLDPAQNCNFVDHYLDLPFDLSRVMFIATVNIQTELPAALRDRLEIIDLPGYIPEEKLEIAWRYLVPRQREAHGLSRKQLQISRPTLRRIVAEYTHEAGVRELDRTISKLCRKRAVAVVASLTSGSKGSKDLAKDSGKDSGKQGKEVAKEAAKEAKHGKSPLNGHDTAEPAPQVFETIGPLMLPSFLGPPKKHDDRLQRRPVPGVAVGLAWTPVGGDVLFIEAVAMPGKGNVKVTGHLGDVMKESTKLAMTYVQTRAALLGIHLEVFKVFDFHLHFPAGAVPKDGPSAGITITTALVSLLTQRPIKPRLAMTGEITLQGEVLPVGGIREKVVAARRAGVRIVVLPERNQADIEEIPKEVRQKLTFVFASSYATVLRAAFEAGWDPRQVTARASAIHRAQAAARRSRPLQDSGKDMPLVPQHL